MSNNTRECDPDPYFDEKTEPHDPFPTAYSRGVVRTGARRGEGGYPGWWDGTTLTNQTNPTPQPDPPDHPDPATLIPP